jgi:hypothetical protein
MPPYSDVDDVVAHLRETRSILWTGPNEGSLIDKPVFAADGVTYVARWLAHTVHVGSSHANALHGTRDGAACGPYDVDVTEELFTQLMATSATGDTEFWKHTTRRHERAFMFVDISEFSQLHGNEQQLVVTSLIRLADGMRRQVDVEAQLCIGDGYVYAFRSTELAVLAAMPIR